jgi:hypothetical protein
MAMISFGHTQMVAMVAMVALSIPDLGKTHAHDFSSKLRPMEERQTRFRRDGFTWSGHQQQHHRHHRHLSRRIPVASNQRGEKEAGTSTTATVSRVCCV